ncbi:Uncharacterised protein [uncultured archaeon]|nr:Uncharacterised protein [uncultured archaeon]
MLVSALVWSKLNEMFTLKAEGVSVDGGNVKIGAVRFAVMKLLIVEVVKLL